MCVPLVKHWINISREPVQDEPVQDHRGMCVNTGEHSICYTNAETMHLRLGHPSKEVTRRMGYPSPATPCKWCMMGKSRKAVSPTKPIPKGKARLDKVHVDIKISNTPDRHGRTRMLGIVDTYSNCSRVKSLRDGTTQRSSKRSRTGGVYKT